MRTNRPKAARARKQAEVSAAARVVSTLSCASVLALSSGCISPPISPKYTFSFDHPLEAAVMDGQIIAERVARIAKSVIEARVGPDNAVAAYERVLAGLGATCRAETRGIRCIYLKTRVTPYFRQPWFFQMAKYVITVTSDRTGAAQLVVCVGLHKGLLVGKNEMEADTVDAAFLPYNVACSPPSVRPKELPLMTD